MHPRSLSVYFILGTLFVIQLFGQAAWTPIGPGAGSDLLTARFQPDNPSIIYLAGDIEGIFKTIDGGQTWHMINRGLGDGNHTANNYGIQEIVIDPGNYQTVYACTWQGLFNSTDGGENWSFMFPQPFVEDTPPISFMAVDPSNSSILYAGIGDADTDADGEGAVYRSTNGCADWTLLDIAMSDTAVIHGIVIDPTSATTDRHIFVSTGQGIYRSLDNGQTWSSANTGLPHQNVRRMEYSLDNGNFVLLVSLHTEGNPATPATYGGGIFKSTNDGTSWVDITGDLPRQPYDDPSDPPPFYDYWKFTVAPDNPNLIYTATNFGNWGDAWGIYKTTDGGAHWDWVYNNVSLGWMDDNLWHDHNYTVLRMAPGDPNQLIAGSVRVLRSSDAGQSWQAAYTTAVGTAWHGNGVELMIAQDMAFDPTEPNRLFVGYDDFGIWRSADGGYSFKPLDPYEAPYGEVGYDAGLSIVVDPVNGDVYLGRNNGDTMDWLDGYPIGKVWKSTDHGDTWAEITSGLPEGRPQLVMDPTSPENARVLYCAVYGHGVYKTLNSGAAWSAVNTGLGNAAGLAFTLVMDPDNPQTLYLGLRGIWGGTGGIYKTANGGASWSKLTNFPEQDILSLAVDPNNTQILYAGAVDVYDFSQSGGLYKSTDGGATWAKILDQPRVNVVVPIPGEPNVLYAAVAVWFQYFENQAAGFYYSSDGGANWTNIGDGLGHKNIVTAELNPNDANELLVGTLGGGIWKLDRSSVAIAPEQARPAKFELYPAFPNPFNPATWIKYDLYRNGHVKLVIYNLLGERVQTLVDADQQTGYHEARWQGRISGGVSAPAGIYFLILEINGQRQMEPLVYLK